MCEKERETPAEFRAISGKTGKMAGILPMTDGRVDEVGEEEEILDYGLGGGSGYQEK